MRILGIAGSLRASSSNAAILRAARKVAPPNVEVVIYEGLGSLPHFSPDLDVEATPPPQVAELRALIGGADALMISSPEYAHGMPGSLKNLLDWMVSAVEAVGKPVLLLSASPGGAAHAHAQLAEVVRTMSMQLIDAGAHVFSRSKLDAGGEVVDAQLLALLERMLPQLIGGPSG